MSTPRERGRPLDAAVAAELDAALGWVGAAPNTEETWARVRETAETILSGLWRHGRLVGAKPAQAYFARCDRTTMTAADVAGGRLVLLVGYAPVRPAEFRELRIVRRTA